MTGDFEKQTVSVTCPFCGQAGHASFGQSVIGSKLRWHRSVACPVSGAAEEDGAGGGDVYLRNELLKSNGHWAVRVKGVEKAKSIAMAKRLFSLSNDDASSLVRSFPNLPIGTKAEADWLVAMLATIAIGGETVPPHGS